MDLKNGLTYTNLLTAAARATNNVAGSGVDLSAYEGPVAVLVNIGTKTAGDNDASVVLQLQESASNSAAAATNIASASVATTNNTTAHSTVLVDPRARLRYLFARWIISAGTNSPSYPVAVSMVGIKQVQP